MQLVCTSERSLQRSTRRYKIIQKRQMQISTRKISSDSDGDGYLKKKIALLGKNTINVFQQSCGLGEARDQDLGER